MLVDRGKEAREKCRETVNNFNAWHLQQQSNDLAESAPQR